MKSNILMSLIEDGADFKLLPKNMHMDLFKSLKDFTYTQIQLLEQGIDLTQTDSRGYNYLHIFAEESKDFFFHVQIFIMHQKIYPPIILISTQKL